MKKPRFCELAIRKIDFKTTIFFVAALAPIVIICPKVARADKFIGQFKNNVYN